MDAAKVIAAAALYDGDPWDLIGHGQEDWVIPTQALPVITVPTLAATGSEMNSGAVISNDDTKVKSFVQTECLFPKVALVDPELTLTVPKDQTAYGVCDITTHATESYFNGVDGTPIQDRFAAVGRVPRDAVRRVEQRMRAVESAVDAANDGPGAADDSVSTTEDEPVTTDDVTVDAANEGKQD